MLGFFKQTNPILGLDISDQDLKLIEIKRRDQQYFIEFYASEKITSGCPKTMVLRKLIEKSERQGCEVAIAVSGPSVMTCMLQLEGHLSAIELEEHIDLGLEAWVPFQLEEVFYDFAVLGPNEQDPTTRDIRLAVAKRDFIQDHLKWIEATGIKVAVIDVESIALERASHFLKQNPEFNMGILKYEGSASDWFLSLGLALWAFGG